MDKARPVVAVNFARESAVWLSDDRLLIVSTDQEVDSGLDQPGKFIPKNWKGHADIFNRITGERTRQSGLTDRLNRTSVFPGREPSYFVVSPDGAWLLWECANWGDGWPLPRASRIDGSCYRTWDRTRYDESFFLDDRHYVQMTEWEPMMVVRDLQDPTKDRKYLDASPTEAVLAQYAVRRPVRIVVADQDYSPAGSVEIDSYRTVDRIRMILSLRDDGHNAPRPVRTHFVKLPEGARLVRADLSSQEQSICYQLQTVRTEPLLAWLHRIIPKIGVKPVLTEGLWISRADGQGMREIGHVDGWNDTHTESEDQLKDIQWLPSGKQVSFVYHNTLYIAPAGTKGSQ